MTAPTYEELVARLEDLESGISLDQLPLAQLRTALIDNGPPIDVVNVLQQDKLHEPGDVKASARAAPSAGWMLCDGRAISRAGFSDLFAAIGTAHGAGDGSTTFNIPDLRGRVPLGVGTAAGAAGATAHTLGQLGGEETHTLTTPEIPSHTHALAMGTGASANNLTDIPTRHSGAADSSAFGGPQAAGGGGAHNTLPPYAGLNFFIKY